MHTQRVGRAPTRRNMGRHSFDKPCRDNGGQGQSGTIKSCHLLPQMLVLGLAMCLMPVWWGALQMAQHQLERALRLSQDPSLGLSRSLLLVGSRASRLAHQDPTFQTPAATPAEVAQYRCRLGRTCWALRGDLRTNKQHAHAHWLAAAAVESAPCRAAAFAWLGKYYNEIGQDGGKARRCFQRALAIDPAEDVAGEALDAASCIVKILTLIGAGPD